MPVLAQINETEIFFDVVGSGLRDVDGRFHEVPTIIALHGGLGFDHAYLRDGLDQLGDLAQIVYVDLRGQGRSARPSLETATMEQMADDVAGLCAYLGIKRPYIFGHSAGGFVALYMALRHPELVGGLILSGSSPTVAPIQSESDGPQPALVDRASPAAMQAAGRVFSGDISVESVATFFKEVGPYYAGPLNMDLTARLMRVTSQNVDMMRHFMTKIAPTYDLSRELARITFPTLVMVGKYDWVCPPRASRAISKGVPNAKLVEFEDSGHFLFSEEPQKFYAEVQKFLEDATARN